jgi:parallel beta-helix repeat protein
VIRKNVVLSNSSLGIDVQGSGNVISGNRALGNGLLDLEDFDSTPPCGTNTWKSNLFGTAGPQTCIR